MFSKKLVQIIIFLALAATVTACGEPGLPSSNSIVMKALDETNTIPATPQEAAATTTPVPAATPAGPVCHIAYSVRNELYCAEVGGKPVLIAQGQGWLSKPAISSDGLWVAYTDNLDDGSSPLWVAKADGSEQRTVVSARQVNRNGSDATESPLAFQWKAGTHTLLFSTHYNLPRQVQPLSGIVLRQEYLNADLLAIDVDSGQVKQILPEGSAGQFSLSPDGKLVALASPHSIDLANADGTRLRRVIEFSPVQTRADDPHSVYAYEPDVAWNPDSTFFNVAIPSPDPFAADALATLYRVAADGSVQKLTTVNGNFVFGDRIPITFSPDGKHVTFGRTDPASGVTSLYLVDAETGEEELVIHPEGVNRLGWLGWSPDSQHYAYSLTRPLNTYSLMPQDGGVVVTLTGGSQQFTSWQQVISLDWLDDDDVLFFGRINVEWGLYVQQLDGRLQPLVQGLARGVTFDAKQP